MSGSTTWVAMIGLAEARLPDLETVCATLAEQWPDVPLPQPSSQTAGMVTTAWGSATAAYTLVPMPIPWTQLEGPCAAAWFWPQAEETLRGHAAHLLVTIVDEGRDAIAKVMKLTRFATALASDSASLGILWAAAGLIHEPAAFAQQASQMSPENLPLYLWIDFRIEPLEGGGWRLFTTGLEAFDRKELEVTHFDGDAQRLLESVYNVAHYHLTDPSKFKDGDSIGLPDGTRIVARHQASMLSEDKPVIGLEFE